MPLVPVHNVGRYGLMFDAPPAELPPEAWTAGTEVRFLENKVVRFTGFQSVFATASVDPYGLFPVRSGGQIYWVYAGLSDVYATEGSLHKQISKSPAAYSATELRGWNGGVIGGIPVLNNGVDAPQMWNPVDFATPGLLSDLTAWPASTTCRVLRVFGNFLVALYITKSGTEYPHMVKWSHPAAVGAVPASWDETDPTQDAGENELGTTPGAMVDCVQLRDINVIYKEDAIWGQQYIRAPLIFRFWPITESVGAMSRRCIKEYRGRHFIFGFDDIMVTDGNQIRSIVDKRVRRVIFNTLNGAYAHTCFVAIQRDLHEAWFCFPGSEVTRPNVAAVYNIRDDTWGTRTLAGNGLADLQWDIVDTGAVSTWDADSEVWDSDVSTWDGQQFDSASGAFLGAVPGTAANRLVRFEDGYTADGSNRTAYVERTGLALTGVDREGMPKVNYDTVKFCRAIRPKMTSNGPINIYCGSQMERNDPIAWEGPVSFDPSTDVEAHFQTSGRLLAVRFESIDATAWELESYDLDIEVISRY